MSNNYLLTCDCGHLHVVGTGQAGKSVACPCGRRLTVPSLRAIRQLPPATAPTKSKSPRRDATWNPLKGTLFASGIVLFLIGAVITGYCYWAYSHLVEFRPSDSEYDTALNMIEQMPPDEMLQTWHFIKEQGLEPTGSSPFAVARRMTNEKLRLIYIGSGMIVVGLLVAITPMFLRSR